jgi:DNA topoisomerase-3
MQKPLYIAEKPNMGAAIAAQLPGPHKRGDGFIETGGGLVTWAVGHLLEQLPPEGYDPKYKRWDFADLPIVPTVWKLETISGKQKQVGVIKSLLRQCDGVVNAGDPGREGQLIVDEILVHLNNKKPVFRLLLPSLDAPTVQKALANLQPNAIFQPLYEAALGRQRADWVVGMNLTRAYTLLGRKHGYDSVLSVGRVQTPTLAIVVKREIEIENFVPQTYFSLRMSAGDQPNNIAPFWTRWLPPGAKGVAELAANQAASPTGNEDAEDEEEEIVAHPGLDAAGRLVDPALAQQVFDAVSPGTPATVTADVRKPAVEKPPLPFKLSGVQSKMNTAHGAGVQDTLAGCQSLYDKGIASYPRTDCQYLPPAQLPEAPGVLAAIAAAFPALAPLVAKADVNLVSPAWNEAKLGEHHAIIPTASPGNVATLSPLEQHIYEAICRRYLAQFLPNCEVDKAAIELEAGGHRWVAKGRTVRIPGWREAYQGEEIDDDGAKAAKADKVGADLDANAALPKLTVGQVLAVADRAKDEKKTTPPPRYNEGSLLLAMEFVHRLVDDPAEKKMLKSVEGIGRAATRANIIGTLLKRGYLGLVKKQLHPSPSARTIVAAVDPALTDPGLTARWEQGLDGVATGRISLEMFQQRQETWIRQLVAAVAASTLPPPPAGMAAAPRPAYSGGGSSSGSAGKSTGARKTASRTSSKSASAPAAAGKPLAGDGQACPQCGKPMRSKTVQGGAHKGKQFLGCTGYPACKHSVWPK